MRFPKKVAVAVLAVHSFLSPLSISNSYYPPRLLLQVNRRTAVLFANKKFPRRQPHAVTSPLAQPSVSLSIKSDTAASVDSDRVSASQKKPVVKTTQSLRSKQVASTCACMCLLSMCPCLYTSMRLFDITSYLLSHCFYPMCC